jgi:hypothetical protein
MTWRALSARPSEQEDASLAMGIKEGLKEIWDDMMSYRTLKVVKISDARLSYVHKTLMASILVYSTVGGYSHLATTGTGETREEIVGGVYQYRCSAHRPPHSLHYCNSPRVCNHGLHTPYAKVTMIGGHTYMLKEKPRVYVATTVDNGARLTDFDKSTAEYCNASLTDFSGDPYVTEGPYINNRCANYLATPQITKVDDASAFIGTHMRQKYWERTCTDPTDMSTCEAGAYTRPLFS